MITNNIKNHKEIEKVEFTIVRKQITSTDGRFNPPKKRSKKTIDTQSRILNFIYEQTGLKLNVDDYFNQIENHQSKRYFNVDLGERLYLSTKFEKLKRLATYSETIHNVEANGTKRVAIYFK